MCAGKLFYYVVEILPKPMMPNLSRESKVTSHVLGDTPGFTNIYSQKYVLFLHDFRGWRNHASMGCALVHLQTLWKPHQRAVLSKIVWVQDALSQFAKSMEKWVCSQVGFGPSRNHETAIPSYGSWNLWKSH